jgi:hypothetical protein
LPEAGTICLKLSETGPVMKKAGRAGAAGFSFE